jgi:cytoskeletal protein CcmA (bactofilin family)
MTDSPAERQSLENGPGPVRRSIPFERPAPRPTTLSRSTRVIGDVWSEQDLILAGAIEGSIDLPDHALTIAPEGRLSGQAFAQVIIVSGRVAGDLTASERIEVLETGRVEGDLTAPKVAIDLGAFFRGRVEMKRADAAVRVAKYRMERKSGVVQR